MKKSILLIICLICFFGEALAQKPVVYLAPFKYDKRDIRGLVPAFRAAVINGITSSGRVNIIDGESSQNPSQSVIESARSAGADIVFECELLSNNLNSVINVMQALDDALRNKSSYIYEKMSYHVVLTRVSDQIVIHTKQYDNSTSVSTSFYSSGGGISAAGQALTRATDNALIWVSQQMMTYFEREFPLEARIVDFAEVKRDKLKKVYIDLGSNSPVRKNIYFNVYVERTVAGENIKDCIGQLRVDEVKGEKRSLCTVNRGAAQIKEAVENGQELILLSVVR